MTMIFIWDFFLFLVINIDSKMNKQEDNLEESYKQIIISNDCFSYEENMKFDALNNRSIFLIFILLICTSQVRSLPVSPGNSLNFIFITFNLLV